MGNGENESPLKKALIYNQIEFFYDRFRANMLILLAKITFIKITI